MNCNAKHAFLKADSSTWVKPMMFTLHKQEGNSSFSVVFYYIHITYSCKRLGAKCRNGVNLVNPALAFFFHSKIQIFERVGVM